MSREKPTRRRPTLNITPPHMAHGDADRMADICAQAGTPLVPWQRDFLNRMESASMSEQFAEIVAAQFKAQENQ